MHKEFLEYVIKSITFHPDDVRIEESRDDMGVLLVVNVHHEDMGSVVGRSGNTAKAIRSLLHIVGMKHGARVSMKINEPVGGKRYIEE
jgi:predicted RNA-binding protein YlqC (UPF0109 family)